VECNGEHGLLRWATAPASFSGTGVPWLDDPKERWHVRWIHGTELELLNAQMKRPDRPCDTSMGQLRILPLHAPFVTGFLRLPLIAWVLILLILVSVCIGVVSLNTPEIATCFAFAVLAVALFHLARWRRSRRTQIRKSHEIWRLRLLERHPRPKECERGPKRALRAEQLIDLYNFFQAHIRGRNMYYICPNIVKPLTSRLKLSYAELAGPSGVDWFVSHYWGMPFKDFVSSITKHAQSVSGGGDWQSVAYWVCTFSNNQWRVTDEVGSGDWQESSFYKALRSGMCRGTAMVLDNHAWPLTRTWCLFEVLQTKKLEEDDPNFAGLLLCTSSGVLNYGTASMDVATELAKSRPAAWRTSR